MARNIRELSDEELLNPPKRDITAISDEELLGGELEERISKRKDVLSTAFPQLIRGAVSQEKGSGRELLKGILGTAAGVFQRGEAAVAGPIFEAIRQHKEAVPEERRKLGFIGRTKMDIEEIKRLGGEFIKGIKGERSVERGDIFRELGFPEFASATLGLVTDPFIIKAFFTKGGVTLSTKALQQGDNLIDDVFTKAIKPTIRGRKSFGLFKKAKFKANEAVRTIVENQNSLQYVDEATGQVTKGLPKNLGQFSSAINQTQQQLWDEAIAPALKASKKAGVVIKGNEIAGALDDVIKNRAIAKTNPRLIEKAKELQNLFLDETFTPTEAQAILTRFNAELTRFFKTPGATFTETTEKLLQSHLARKTREVLNREVSKITGTEFSVLKSKYGALSSIEEDVIRAVIRNSGKSKGIVSSFINTISTGAVITGALTLRPTIVAAGITQKLVLRAIEAARDPNRLVRKMFEQLQILKTPGKMNILKQIGIRAGEAKVPAGVIGLKEALK